MKTQLTRHDIELNEPVARDLFGQEFISKNTHLLTKYGTRRCLCWREGTVLDTPDSWTFVVVGAGIPADEECSQHCNRYGEWALRIDSRAEAYQEAEDRCAAACNPLLRETWHDDGIDDGDQWAT